MGLKHGNQSTPRETLARRTYDRGDLRRVMRIVVDDSDVLVEQNVEATSYRLEAAKSGGDASKIDSSSVTDTGGRQCVANVVLTRNAETDRRSLAPTTLPPSTKTEPGLVGPGRESLGPVVGPRRTARTRRAVCRGIRSPQTERHQTGTTELAKQTTVRVVERDRETTVLGQQRDKVAERLLDILQ